VNARRNVAVHVPPQSAPGSFVRSARRGQIVGAAVAVIAELGVARASVVKIAAHAGVSRGVVAYHFRDLDDVHDAVVAEVYRLGGERLRERVASAPTPRDALLVFAGGSVGFYAEFPRHMVALQEILAERRRTRTGSRDALPEHGREIDDVAALLAAGREAGQFRDLDPRTTAGIVRAVLDSVVARVAVTPPLPADEVDAIRREVVAAVDGLTRREHP